jgi:hypothetical protein
MSTIKTETTPSTNSAKTTNADRLEKLEGMLSQVLESFNAQNKRLKDLEEAKASTANSTATSSVPHLFGWTKEMIEAHMERLKDKKKVREVQKANYEAADQSTEELRKHLNLEGTVKPMTHVSRGELVGVVVATAVAVGTVGVLAYRQGVASGVGQVVDSRLSFAVEAANDGTGGVPRVHMTVDAPREVA